MKKRNTSDFFSSAGWSHVASEGNIHLFRGKPGTNPIYTDRDTTVEKYKNSISFMENFAIPSILLATLVWVGAMISSGTLKSILLIAAIILSIIAVPSAWTVISTYTNKWKVEERKQLVNLVKVIPPLLLLISVIILLFINGKSTTVNILLSIIIGGIVLPTAIWVIMFLYHKVRENCN